MNIFVYSDESGVFDKAHNDYFVFGGLIFLSKNDKDVFSRKYVHAEQVLKKYKKYNNNQELKACKITNADKNKLFRATNQVYRFGVVVNQNNVLDSIFKSKKDKQRFLDYAYKRAVKDAFNDLIAHGIIKPDEVENIHFFVDEHTTATNGKYELRECLEQEFKFGTYNYNYSKYFPPILPNAKNIELYFCDSNSKPLIRAADIIANRIYYLVNTKSDYNFSNDNIHILRLP